LFHEKKGGIVETTDAPLGIRDNQDYAAPKEAFPNARPNDQARWKKGNFTYQSQSTNF
jgi:hypothetical protein